MPTPITAIAKMVNIMAIIQSSPIDIAAKSERNWLFLLIAWIVISALITGLLTALLYGKTGKYQEAVQSEANARISESNAEAKRAGESAGLANERAGIANESAGKANERAEKLEGQNIELRKDLESATAESRAKQSELATQQTVLATEQRKTAEAQREAAIAQLALKKHLEEVAERQTPRILTAEQKHLIVAILSARPKGEVEMEYPVNSAPETLDFANQIRQLLIEAGWKADNPVAAVLAGTPKGLFVIVGVAQNPPAAALQEAFRSAGIPLEGELDAGLGKKILFLVGHKP
jgi:hypothetical protein